MMSASEGEGGSWRADVVREVAGRDKSGPNADKGGRGQKSEHFADVINESSLETNT